MRGRLDQIEVHPFDAAAMPAFETFEAEHAKCYSPDDKARPSPATHAVLTQLRTGGTVDQADKAPITFYM